MTERDRDFLEYDGDGGVIHPDRDAFPPAIGNRTTAGLRVDG